MNIVFFGTADFAVPSLEALISAGHTVLAVVTQPDKPTGRGMQLAASPVKKAAERFGLKVIQPRRVRSESFIEKVRALAPDLLVVAAFGQIVPQSLLDIPPLGPINVHGSLLPAFRGAAPIQRAIMAGEARTGVTTMWMDATLDTGDILLQVETPILPEDTTGTVFPRLAELGAGLLIETIERLRSGNIRRQPQDDALSSQAPKIDPADCELRWTETAKECRNRIRGLSPRPGAVTVIAGKRLKVWNAEVIEEITELETGSVIGISKLPAGLKIAAGNGTVLLLTEIQPENGKRMSADAWARGVKISALA